MFSDYRVTVCKDFVDAARYLARLLPSKNLLGAFKEAYRANRINKGCGLVELDLYKGYRWGFRRVDNGFALVIVPATMPQTGFTLDEAIRLERKFSRSYWFEPPYSLAPHTADEKIASLIRLNQQNNRHWSCKLH